VTTRHLERPLGSGDLGTAFAVEKRDRRTLSQDILIQLRSAIVMGQIPPGAPLRLEQLAALFDVSVSPVREALRQLEMIGLVEHSPYRGARVSLLSVSEMQETYEIRHTLERLAVHRAAERFTRDDALSAQSALQEIEQAYRDNDFAATIRGNTTFHLAIGRAADSERLLKLIVSACETTERYSASLLKQHRPDEMQHIEREGHIAILEACRNHDSARAQEALSAHMEVFERLFTTMLGEAEGRR
jgi:DNA-binding GntR family transcriptional regulator